MKLLVAQVSDKHIWHLNDSAVLIISCHHTTQDRVVPLIQLVNESDSFVHIFEHPFDFLVSVLSKFLQSIKGYLI